MGDAKETAVVVAALIAVMVTMFLLFSIPSVWGTVGPCTDQRADSGGACPNQKHIAEVSPGMIFCRCPRAVGSVAP